MKKATLVISVAIALILSACGNANKNNDSKQTTEEKSEKVQGVMSQQDFEKILEKYGISLYADMEFESIKNNGDEIGAQYTVPDLSEENHQKAKEYIANELSKLKNDGWGVEESFGIAMKKEDNYKVSIQFTQRYASDLKIHWVVISYGKVY